LRFDNNVFPSLIEGSLYSLGYIDDLLSGNNLEETMNEAVVHLAEPETVLLFTKFVKVSDLVTMEDRHSASK